MASLTLERLLFDPSDADGSPNLGAYLRSSDGTLLTHTTDGGREALDVFLVGSDGIYDEDTAHTTGDSGFFMMAVRNDTQGSLVDTDGDYAPFQVDSEGRLRVVADFDLTGDLVGDGEVDSEDPLKVGGHAYNQGAVLTAVDAGDKANLAQDLYRRVFMNDAPNIGIQVAAVTVDDTLGGINLSASPLAGRMRMSIQNNGNESIFLGPSGVTIASGIELSKGGTYSLEIGEALDMYAIGDTGASVDVRVLELA